MDLNQSMPYCVCDESGGEKTGTPNVTDVTVQIFFSFFLD